MAVKSFFTVFIVFTLFFCCIPTVTIAAEEDVIYCPNRVWLYLSPSLSSQLVRTDDGKIFFPTGNRDLDAILAEYRVQVLYPTFTHDPISKANPSFYSIGLDRHYTVKLTDPQFQNLSDRDLFYLCNQFKSVWGVEDSAPIPLHWALLTPNDWNLGGRSMWGLDAMFCRQAWDTQTGNPSILAVTIDTGVNFTHEDLAANFAVNPAEDINGDGQFSTADLDNIDNDNNGFVDDVIGWDFVSHSYTEVGGASAAQGEDYGPRDNIPSDVHGHGTHVAGSLIAVTNNSVGVCAASFNVKTFGMRAGFAFIYNGGLTGAGFVDDFVAAVQYAVNRGARIISISFGGSQSNTSYAAAISYARVNNCLVFGAAGNSGNTSPRYPAAYDSALAVAAVQPGLIKADFSNHGAWVDFAGPGVNIWSTMVVNTYNPQAYVNWDGTSMAAPNVASAAALILSRDPGLTDNELESIMRNTATDISDLNPGYQLGSGVPNTNAAVNSITPSGIYIVSPNGGEEWWLEQNQRIRWIAADSIQNVRIQINRSFPSNNWETLFASTPNDSQQYWLVNGDTSSFCRIRILNAANLSRSDTSSQNFAIRMPWIQLTSPTGTDVLRQGIAHTITWNSGGIDSVMIELNRNYPNGAWEIIVPAIANTGSYAWTVTPPASNNARMRISYLNHSEYNDVSDSSFVILTPGITVTAPNAATDWYINTTQSIRWYSIGVGRVNIEINRSYPSSNWETIANNALSNGIYNWLVTGPTTNSARIRVTNANNPNQSDTSDVNFNIVPSDVIITSPNGGEELTINTTYSITWTRLGINNARIEINRNYPSGAWELLASNVTAAGVWNWQVTAPPSSGARIRILSETNPSLGDTSDANFTISAPWIRTIYPTGEDTIFIRLNTTLQWQSAGFPGNVRIELNRNYPSGTWEILFDSIANSGTQVWSVTGPSTNRARIRIRALSDTATALTPSNFSIIAGTYTILEPNGGEVLTLGSNYDIRWISNLPGRFNIQIDRNYPSGQWATLFYGTPNDGVQRWVVNSPTSNAARIRLVYEGNSAFADTSDGNFIITASSVLERLQGIPTHYECSIYPNPFNAETSIRLAIPESGDLSVSIYDMNGRLVSKLVQEFVHAGSYTLRWNSQTHQQLLPSGIYFLRVQTKHWRTTEKLVLLK
ncbi:MAG: S8 family peptidase [bacterium]|nr:S8 family peptidase [bacterium]